MRSSGSGARTIIGTSSLGAESNPVRAAGAGGLWAINGSDCATLFGSLLNNLTETFEFPEFSRAELRCCK
jgi:hypothetical protein